MPFGDTFHDLLNELRDYHILFLLQVFLYTEIKLKIFVDIHLNDQCTK